MGSFVFKWPYAAEEVYVTGTFDNWSKSVKLDKVGEFFEKSVELPDASSKIYYKFVVDGAWVTDAEAPKEKDEHGNDNNVLTPEHIIKSAPATAALLATVTPESTTAALAKDVPLEEKKEPEEPATAAAASTAETAETAKMPEDVPGTFPETPASELDKEVKLINPLPAAPGGVNPVKLAPGEPIPESLKSGDINANVKLDPESYEKADAAIAGDFSATELPPVSKNMIPESSLPIAGSNDVTISSVTPVATTVALAGAVPLEKDKAAATEAAEPSGVPAVVTESQQEAGFAPEASAVPEEVKEKAEVEEELLAKVPEAPATSEGGGASSATTAGVVAGVTAAAAGLGAAAVATATPAVTAASETVSDAATKLPVSVKQVLPTSVQEQIATTAATEGQTTEEAANVPAEVKESIQESGKSPEAAANPVAVEEKKAVEAELLQKTTTSAEPAATEPAATEPAATEPAAESAAAPVAAEPVVASSAAPVANDPAAASSAAPVAAEPAAASTEPAAASSAAPATTANGTGTPAALAAATAAVAAHKTPGPASTTSGPTSVERKKKHRISGFFHKLLHKNDADKK